MFPRLIEQHSGLLHLTLVLCALISVFLQVHMLRTFLLSVPSLAAPCFSCDTDN